MVDKIGQGGLARNAIEAALQAANKRHTQSLERMQAAAGGLDAPQQTDKNAFAEMVKQGVGQLDEAVKDADRLPLEVIQGKLDFHEVAARLKKSELAFDFAMQVRNKFIDAYREVMRMSV
jgi:flagellar hook-basal body complex protein FliE